jgi:PAS domain S-box-containing protein
LKWIIKNGIEAFKYAGGHYRIPREKLNPYIVEDFSSISTPVNHHQINYCWEYHSEDDELNESCRDCIIFASKAEKCFLLAGIENKNDYAQSFCKSSCKECEYFEFINTSVTNVLVITENETLKNELKESQIKYQLLFEEVPCFISIQDRNLKVVDANRMFREAFGSCYGKYCYEIYKHRKSKCEPCIIEQTFRDGEIHTHEEVVTDKNGKRINVMVFTAPLRDANGNIDKVIEMSADITEIRQLQDKLTSVGLLIGSISHGIKGLLNGLDGGIYLVNTGLKKDDRDRLDRGWEIASRNIRRIRSMVMDILYYAKDREPEWESILIKELADDIQSLFKDRAEKQGIRFNLHIDTCAEEFEADQSAVKSLIINLLDNSLDACRIDKKKDAHEISLNINCGDGRIKFEVSDNGIGMDQETREKALSLFFSSKGAGGTGLGLFIANKIAEAHGGQVKIESEEGKGSKFTVSLLSFKPKLEPVN